MRRQVRFAITGTLGLFLVLVASQAFGVVRDYDIQLNPQGNTGGTLGVQLAFGQSCGGNPHNGCMNFEVDTVGVISLRVVGNPHSVNCTYPPGPGQSAKFVITKIELTDKPYGGSSTSTKGDFSGGLADTWLKQYAFPQVDQATGVLYNVSKDDGLARMTLVNLNGHPEETDAKPFWYKVTVTDCDDSTITWETDPRGDNRGSN